MIDLIYVSVGRISPIYLLDALLEVVLIVWWAVIWIRKVQFQTTGIGNTQQVFGDTVGRSCKVGGGLTHVRGILPFL